jgi:acetylcholinesterase
MPSSAQIFLVSLSVIGLAIFWSSWLQGPTRPFVPGWSQLLKGPQVKIAQGYVVGTILEKNFPGPVEAFMGLPYAQPPTGNRRFRRAEPLPESDVTFKAQEYGPMSVFHA